jgi:hypothetical protein
MAGSTGVGQAPHMHLAEQTQPLCALTLRADREEVCPGEECPLWEDGGCALERMTADGELYEEPYEDGRGMHPS